jgi:hypothetical protein
MNIKATSFTETTLLQVPQTKWLVVLCITAQFADMVGEFFLNILYL